MFSTVARIFFSIFVIVLTLESSAGAERVLVDNEDFTDSHDLAFDSIHTLVSSSCHGGFMLVGLDYAGEWVEYDLTISSFGSWATGLVCRGDSSVHYTLQLKVTGTVSGASQTIDIVYNGLGYG